MATTRLATAAEVARMHMTWSIEDNWEPADWRANTHTLPDDVANAVVTELRARVIAIKDDPERFHGDHDTEEIRQAALNEVLRLMQDYANPHH